MPFDCDKGEFDDVSCAGFHHTGAALDELDRLKAAQPKFDLIKHLQDQAEFSQKTFGPGVRIKGHCDHLRKEIEEVAAAKTRSERLEELTDILILTFDAALRESTPEQIVASLVAKQAQNESREWPDWRKADPDKAIEHVRTINENRDFNG